MRQAVRSCWCPVLAGPLLVGLCVLILACGQPTSSQQPRAAEVAGTDHIEQDSAGLDFSGMPLFWAVADTLAAGRLPSAARWDRLFTHPGYALPIDIAQRGDELKTCIPAVFHPEQRSRLDSLLYHGTSLERRICSHLLRGRLLRDSLDQYQQIVRDQPLFPDAIPHAMPYLPAPLPDTLKAPAVYVILNEPTNWGWDGTISLDVLDMMDRPREDIVLTLAHEVHHAYAAPLFQVDLPNREDPSYGIIQQFERLRSEGMASLIDKRRFVGSDPDTFERAEHRTYATAFTEGVRVTPKALRRVDSVLAAVHQGAIPMEAAGPAIRDALSQVPYSPHIPGLAMALAIEQVLGRERLVASSLNLFRFVDAYNEAAHQLDAYPVLSRDAMAVLDRLEREWRRQAPIGARSEQGPAG